MLSFKNSLLIFFTFKYVSKIQDILFFVFWTKFVIIDSNSSGSKGLDKYASQPDLYPLILSSVNPLIVRNIFGIWLNLGSKVMFFMISSCCLVSIALSIIITSGSSLISSSSLFMG
jgi:hypothetical protein